MNLGALSPKQFSETLDRCDDKTLKILLTRELSKPGPKQNDGVDSKLYKELKKRGA